MSSNIAFYGNTHGMKKHTKHSNDILCIQHAGVIYHFPKKVAQKYIVAEDLINSDNIFADINKRYTKPGALLRGLRARERMTQIAMAQRIKVTQSDISQMENGTRKIGRTIAKRIEKLFGTNYRSFLE